MKENENNSKIKLVIYLLDIFEGRNGNGNEITRKRYSRKARYNRFIATPT